MVRQKTQEKGKLKKADKRKDAPSTAATMRFIIHVTTKFFKHARHIKASKKGKEKQDGLVMTNEETTPAFFVTLPFDASRSTMQDTLSETYCEKMGTLQDLPWTGPNQPKFRVTGAKASSLWKAKEGAVVDSQEAYQLLVESIKVVPKVECEVFITDRIEVNDSDPEDAYPEALSSDDEVVEVKEPGAVSSSKRKALTPTQSTTKAGNTKIQAAVNEMEAKKELKVGEILEEWKRCADKACKDRGKRCYVHHDGSHWPLCEKTIPRWAHHLAGNPRATLFDAPLHIWDAKLQHNVREHLEAHPDNRFLLSWVPGHAGIRGNEHADELANLGALQRRRLDVKMTTARAKRDIKQRLLERWQRHCAAQDAQLLQRNSLYAAVVQPLRSLRPPAYLSWSRRILGRFLQARTGHGDFAPYHERFNHDDAVTTCHHCGASTNRLHPLACSAFSDHRHLLKDDRGNALSNLETLCTPSAFHAFVLATDAYARSQPRALSTSPSPPPSPSPTPSPPSSPSPSSYLSATSATGRGPSQLNTTSHEQGTS